MKILSVRPILAGALAIGAAAAACFACTEASTTSYPTTEAGTQDRPDAGAVADATTDGETDAGAEGGIVPLTTRVGAAAAISINANLAFAAFKEDEQIIESPAYPDCLIQAGSGNNKPAASGGTMTIGGDAVGQDGGIPAPLQVTPLPEDGNIYVAVADPGLLFERASGQKVQISLDGTAFVPGFAPVTLHSPKFADVVRVTSPTMPDGGDSLVVKSSEPFDVKWTAPTGAVGDEKLIVTFFSLQSDAVVAELRCAFPVGAGQATVPVELMKELRTTLGESAGGAVPGFIRIRSGDFKIVSQPNAAYTIEVSHLTDISFEEGADTPISLE